MAEVVRGDRSLTSPSVIGFEIDPPLDDAAMDELVALWTDVSNAGGAVGFVPPVTTSDVMPIARRYLERVGDGDVHLVVCKEKGRVIGLAFLEHRPGPLFRHWATIKRLQVHPSIQGEGIGSALLQETMEAARSLGLETLHLTVRGGTGTEAFYVRHGAREVARIPGVIRVSPGDDREEIYMILDL